MDQTGTHHHKMHLLILVAGIVLLPKASTNLNCYECVGTGICTTEKQCPTSSHQCGAARVSAYAGGYEVSTTNTKGCALPETCLQGSVNFGVSEIIVTSKCCSSDLCNTENAPAPGTRIPNGKKCYQCDGQTCTATLNCKGEEDHCISVTVGGTKLKGCASKDACDGTGNALLAAAIGGKISCCQGDLCNSASSTSAGRLLLLTPLVFVLMFS